MSARELKIISVAIFIIVFQLAELTVAKTFTIMGTPTKPFKMSTKKGISIEIITMVMQEMGIKDYKFRLVSAVKRAVKEAKSGRVEMLIGYSKKTERLAYLGYPDTSYRRIKWNFFIRKEDQGKIKYDTFEDLKPYTIGVTGGVSYTKKFWEAENFLKFDYTTKNELQLRKLIAKRFDLVPLNTRSTLYEAKAAGILDKISFLPKPLKDKLYFDPVCTNSEYFLPEKDENITKEEKIKIFIEKYDEAIKKLEKNGTINKIYQKYGLEYKY